MVSDRSALHPAGVQGEAGKEGGEDASDQFQIRIAESANERSANGLAASLHVRYSSRAGIFAALSKKRNEASLLQGRAASLSFPVRFPPHGAVYLSKSTISVAVSIATCVLVTLVAIYYSLCSISRSARDFSLPPLRPEKRKSRQRKFGIQRGLRRRGILELDLTSDRFYERLWPNLLRRKRPSSSFNFNCAHRKYLPNAVQSGPFPAREQIFDGVMSLTMTLGIGRS